MGGVFGAGGADDGDSEDDGAAAWEGGVGGGGEMSRLMDKLLGECSKWLELFTPQVWSGVALGTDKSRCGGFLLCVVCFCFL